jgi:hypothetical protein
MDKESLRELWLNSNDPIICQMADGGWCICASHFGPRDEDVAAGRWDFGFQVPGEENTRRLSPDKVEPFGNGLIETKVGACG